MEYFEQIWKFETARFTVTLDCAPESDPDLSWADSETLDALERGVYENVTFRVRVLLDGREVGSDYLGNSVYENVADFRREHIGLAARSRADGVTYGSYFSGMVRQAVNFARSALLSEREVYVRHTMG